MRIVTILYWLLPTTTAFCSNRYSSFRYDKVLFSTVDADTAAPSEEDLKELKSALVFVCKKQPRASMQEVKDAIQELEAVGEELGIGQASSSSGLLAGEWELLYSPEDETRSSPFFWAFQKAFPDNADKIFQITDAIPAPIKEVGPAFQSITYSPEIPASGSFISKVKVSTLGGFATSTMTTKAAIIGVDGVDGIRLKIETTKPEGWTLYDKLFGPFGSVISQNAPAFPSGEALERVKPGSSEVVLRTTYCDEGMRISRNDESADVFVWKRNKFLSEDMI
mmetsp:Transcript_10078/g.14795  ORF Transcript_10078/g.14795 Transcript_10078/m.14795 type:complete len:280 (+) Transcript_10078:88-927(+)